MIVFISFLLGAAVGMAVLIGATDPFREGTSAWRHQELERLVGKTTARQLWPLLCAGHLSLFDVKSGVYTIQDRAKMQTLFEQYHADLR